MNHSSSPTTCCGRGIQGISELITVPGLINLDFADVRSIMLDGGAALMSIGRRQR